MNRRSFAVLTRSIPRKKYSQGKLRYFPLCWLPRVYAATCGCWNLFRQACNHAYSLPPLAFLLLDTPQFFLFTIFAFRVLMQAAATCKCSALTLNWKLHFFWMMWFAYNVMIILPWLKHRWTSLSATHSLFVELWRFLRSTLCCAHNVQNTCQADYLETVYWNNTQWPSIAILWHVLQQWAGAQHPATWKTHSVEWQERGCTAQGKSLEWSLKGKAGSRGATTDVDSLSCQAWQQNSPLQVTANSSRRMILTCATSTT